MSNNLISIAVVREHLERGSAFWSGRTSDAGDEDTHATAWAWIARPGAVELAGAEVQVRHPEHTSGWWLTVSESVAR